MGDAFAPWHIIVLLIVLVLLFGSRRLPGAAKSLGQSMHIFKQSVSGLNSEHEQNDQSAPGFNPYGTTTPAPAPPPAQQIQPPPDPTATQLQDLQRQVAELQRQQAGSGNPGQQNQPL
jgi:sec-independent protein translocase protein TatA